MTITANMTLCPTIAAAGFTATQVKNQGVKKMAAFEWWPSELTTEQRREVVIAVWQKVTEEEPQNAGCSWQIARSIGAPEPLVRKIMAEIHAVMTDMVAQKIAGG